MTPIPYKIVTIASGFAGYSLPMFIRLSSWRAACASNAGVSAQRYGPQARAIIEERLGLWVTLGAGVLLVGIVGAVYLF